MTGLAFDGRVAIVTGAGRGLGRAHALALARRGARVCVNDTGAELDGSGGSPDPAEAVVAEIRAAGGEAIADLNSVGTPEGGRAVVQAALDAFEQVDIVVNNAGILQDKTFAKLSPGMVEEVLAVHLAGAFWVTGAAWPHLRDRGYGRVVVTSSMGGYLGNFGQANYGAAKMGLIGLVKALAIEGERYGIRANAIAPAALTRMTESLGLPEAMRRMLPELVSPAVVFLAHESCPVSGEVLAVGGGRVGRVVIGETPGIVREALTAEDIREHWDQIADVTRFEELRSVPEGFDMFFRNFA